MHLCEDVVSWVLGLLEDGFVQGNSMGRAITIIHKLRVLYKVLHESSSVCHSTSRTTLAGIVLGQPASLLEGSSNIACTSQLLALSYEQKSSHGISLERDYGNV
jgi:hypothetical protein